MEKSWKKSWNVMEFGFENCVGTLINRKRKGIVGGKLVRPAIPCKVCFWLAARGRLLSNAVRLV